MRFSRRELLAALAVSGCSHRFIEAGPASPDFPLGVASGDVTASSALVWTQYVGQTPSVRVEWWLRDESEGVVRRQSVVLADDGIVLQPLDELNAGAWYQYVFIATDETGVERSRSDVGQFRAALGEGALAPLTFAVTSCVRQTEPLRSLAWVAQNAQVDAFLQLGDAVYADGAVTLGEYRSKWASGLSRRPNRLMRQATSLIATWDDHEVFNDLSGDKAPKEQFAHARQAFFEHQPVRPQAPDRIWRTLRWGNTAEIFVLDCRTERDHVRQQYISTEQLEWLKAGIASSQATFKLIMNSVPISSYPGALYAAFADDRWEGWPAQRNELVEFVDAHRDGVLWLTGDFHMGVAGRVARSGAGHQQLEVACGPAGSSLANPSMSYPEPPQFDFASAINNVVLLDLNPTTREARVRFVAGPGVVLFDKTYTV